MEGRRMMPKRMAVVTALAGLLTAVLVVSPGDAVTHQPRLEWGDCGPDVPAQYECAMAAVPLDHRKPRGRTTEIALIRLPAPDRQNRIGSVFVGHPFGTFDFIASSPPGALAGFRRFDVIGYDGRGAARSGDPVDCDTDRSQWQPFTSRATVDPKAMVAAAREYGRRCLASDGALLPHLSTAAMARDLDLLRAAVGDAKLTYLGASQGTFIGATYAAMFPGRTRAMVFDAPVDAETWRDRPLDAFRDQAVSTEDVLDRFFAACAAEPAECGFGAGDPRRAFERLLRRLDRHPVASPDPADPEPVDGDAVRIAANEASYSPSFWAPLATALADAERGDLRALHRAARHGFANGLVNDPVSATTNLWHANLAADSTFPRSVARYLRQGAENRRLFPHIGSGVLASGYDLMIPGRWPVRPAESYRGPFRNSAKNAPVLLIGGTHDPATPYSWAKRLTADLGNARLMTYDSDGHGALNDGDPCLLLPVLRYLTDGTLPPAGTVCHQQFDPFPG
jgi:pimeloyl-ACP methyl ester carboxylesterase